MRRLIVNLSYLAYGAATHSIVALLSASMMLETGKNFSMAYPFLGMGAMCLFLSVLPSSRKAKWVVLTDPGSSPQVKR